MLRFRRCAVQCVALLIAGLIAGCGSKRPVTSTPVGTTPEPPVVVAPVQQVPDVVRQAPQEGSIAPPPADLVPPAPPPPVEVTPPPPPPPVEDPHAPRFIVVAYDALTRLVSGELVDPDVNEQVTLHIQASPDLLVTAGQTAFYSTSTTAGRPWAFSMEVEAQDPVAGAHGLIRLWATDKDGHRTDLKQNLPVTFDAVPAFPFGALAPDTLYAIPLAQHAAVGEAVTVVIATGVTAAPLQYLTGVGLVLPADGEFVHRSLDVGVPNTDPLADLEQPDGIWAAIAPRGFLLEPDSFILPSDLGDGTRRWDFNLTPLGGHNTRRGSGALLSVKFRFTTAGVKRFGFQQVRDVKRTYFSDSAGDHFWGNIANDGSGGIANSVTVQ